MRSVKNLLVLTSLVFAVGGSAALTGCAPQEEEDSTGDQTSNVTGGTAAVESPVVWLFDSADKTAAPKCAGALLGEKVAVTVKGCAKEGQLLARAADKNGQGARAKITKVITPPGDDAEIVVVQIDKAIGGTPARLTHMPLRDGYAINGIAAKDGALPVIDPDKGEASSVSASLLEESSTHGWVTPAKGSEICDGDLGAPVCSSVGAKIFNYNIAGTCGLSALVVANDARPAAAGDEQAPPAQNGNACSAAPRKVVSLGKYAAFLKQQAPTAFEPLRIDKPILRNFPYVPDGLWGYETKGTVKGCKIETTALDPIAINAASGKLTAKVSFEQMAKRAAGYGRFGIAPKSDPTKMTWLPAKALTRAAGAASEVTFEGIVSAPADGEYVVAFRTSADGGESWTMCDTDGGEYSADKTIGLKVGTGTTDPNKPGQTEPTGEQPPTDNQDPPASDDTSTGSSDDLGGGMGGEEDEPAPAKKKKASDSGGCNSTGNGTTSTGLPILGALLGLAALKRRRRA